MKTFTSGQVAKICRVSPATANKWFDKGRLRGHRVPGSRHRRIPREDLIQFLKDNDLPLSELEDRAMARALILTNDLVLIDRLRTELATQQQVILLATSNCFDAGHQAKSFHPNCIVIDFDIGQTQALSICQSLRHDSTLAKKVIIALLPSSTMALNLQKAGINEAFEKPFDPALLAKRLQRFRRSR